MTLPCASIVMPFLNGEPYIHEAVESVRAQGYGSWELVMVDDGSADASAAWARREAGADARLRVLSHPGGVNRGLAASRVLGADAARGEYLLFLDHDDCLEPFALERMVAALADQPGVAAVFAETLFWAFDPALGGEDWPQSFAPLPAGQIDRRRMLRELIRSDQRQPACCSTLYRRTDFLAARDCAALYPGMYEDTALLMKLLCFHDVWLLPEIVSNYRMHSASMCHQAEAAGTYSTRGYSPDRTRFLRWALRKLPLDWKSRAVIVKVLLDYGLRTINSSCAAKGVGSAAERASRESS